MLKENNYSKSKKKLQESIAYIDWKQNFYDDVLSGKTPYVSNLISFEEEQKRHDFNTLTF